MWSVLSSLSTAFCIVILLVFYCHHLILLLIMFLFITFIILCFS